MNNHKPTLGLKSQLANILGSPSLKESPRSPNFDAFSQKPKVALPELSKQSPSKKQEIRFPTEENSAILATATSIQHNAILKSNSLSQVVLTEPNMAQYTIEDNFSQIVLTENSETLHSGRMPTFKHSSKVSMTEFEINKTIMSFPNSARLTHTQKSMSISGLKSFQNGSLISSPHTPGFHSRNVSLSKNLKDEAGNLEKVILEKIDYAELERKKQKIKENLQSPRDSTVTSPRMKNITLKTMNHTKIEQPKQSVTTAAPSENRKKLEQTANMYRKAVVPEKVEKRVPKKPSGPGKLSFKPNLSIKTDLDPEPKDLPPAPPVKTEPSQKTSPKDFNSIYKRSKVVKPVPIHKTPKPETERFVFPSSPPQKAINKMELINALSPILPIENKHSNNQIDEKPEPTSTKTLGEQEPFIEEEKLKPIAFVSRRPSALEISPIPSINVSPIASSAQLKDWEFPSSQVNLGLPETNVLITPPNKSLVKIRLDNENPSVSPAKKINLHFVSHLKSDLSPVDEKNEALSMGTVVSTSEKNLSSKNNLTDRRAKEGSIEKLGSLIEGALIKNPSIKQDEVLQIPVGTLHGIDLMPQDDASPITEAQSSPQNGGELSSPGEMSPSRKTKKDKFQRRKSKRHKSSVAPNTQDEQFTRKKNRKFTPSSTPPDESKNNSGNAESQPGEVQRASIKTNRPSLFHRNSQKSSEGYQESMESRRSISTPMGFESMGKRKSSGPGNMSLLEQLHALSKSPHMAVGESKRKMSLIRSLIQEEEASNNSSSFERRNSESYSQERLSVSSLRRASMLGGQIPDIFAGRKLSLKNVKNMLNPPESENASTPSLSQNPSGEEMIKKVSVYKSAMLKSHSYRHVLQARKPKKSVDFRSTPVEKSEFKAKFSFERKNTSATNYKKSTDILTTANFIEPTRSEDGFLQKLNFVGMSGGSNKDEAQNSSPLFAGRSMLTDVLGIEKQIMDFSSLLTRYDENSPQASQNNGLGASLGPGSFRRESSRRLLTKSNTPIRRETKFTINIVPPTVPEEGSVAEQTKTVTNQEDSPFSSPHRTHYEYVLQKDSRRPSSYDSDFSRFENFEDFGAKDFPIEIYLGDVAENNTNLLWNFSNYFSSDKVLVGFLKYFEQLFLKKFPFLISLYDDKLKRGEQEILSIQNPAVSSLIVTDAPVFAPEKYEPNIIGRQDFGEHERIYLEALNHYFANLSSQSHKFERQGSVGSNFIDDLEIFGDWNLSNLNNSLPRQAQSFLIDQGRTLKKNTIIILFSQEVFDTVFKQNYMTFEDYLAFDGMDGLEDNFLDSVHKISKIMNKTHDFNLNHAAHLLFRIYHRVLRGKYEHNYFLSDIVQQPVKAQQNTPEDIQNRIRTFKHRKTLKSSKSTGEVAIALMQQQQQQNNNLITLKTVTHSNSPTQLSFLKSKPGSLSYRGKAPGPSILKPTATLPNDETVSNKEISSMISVRINKTLTKNMDNNNTANDDLKTTKYTDERTLTIEENLRKAEVTNGLSRFNVQSDLRKMETIQDKGDSQSNQSVRSYDAYQKIATAPSEFLQIPSKSFISEEPTQTTQGHTHVKRLSVQREAGEYTSATTAPARKLKALVSQNIMGKSDTIKSDGNNRTMLEQMRITKTSTGGSGAKNIPSIILMKEGRDSKMSEEVSQHDAMKGRNPFRREQSRRMIFQMKKPTPTSTTTLNANNNDEEEKNMLKPERDNAVMRITGNINNRKRSYDPLQRFFNCVRENRVSELEEFFMHHPVAWIDTFDEDGNNALIIAAQSGFCEMITCLLSKGINLNGQNRDKNSALHMAFAYSHYKATDILIRAGASQNLMNKDGRTPWELAN